MSTVYEYWKVQNTGWSGGVSWFDSGGGLREPLRFTDEVGALGYIQKAHSRLDDSTLWRVVHVRIETSENKRVTTEEWKLVNPWHSK